MDVWFVEMAGQRLDIVKFPRIIAGESEGGEREWFNGHPWDPPNLELHTLLHGLMPSFALCTQSKITSCLYEKTSLFGLV